MEKHLYYHLFVSLHRKNGMERFHFTFIDLKEKQKKKDFMCFCGDSRCITATHWRSNNPMVNNFKFRKEREYVYREWDDY